MVDRLSVYDMRGRRKGLWAGANPDLSNLHSDVRCLLAKNTTDNDVLKTSTYKP